MTRIALPVIDLSSGKGRVVYPHVRAVPSADQIPEVSVSGEVSRPGAFDAVLAALGSVREACAPDFHYTVSLQAAELPVSGNSSRLAIAVACWLAERAESEESTIPVLAAEIAMTGNLAPDGRVLPVDALTLLPKAKAAFAAGCSLFLVPPGQAADLSIQGLQVREVATLESVVSDHSVVRWRWRSLTDRVGRRPALVAALLTVLVLLAGLTWSGLGPLGSRPVDVVEEWSPTGEGEFKVVGITAGNVLPYSFARRVATLSDERIMVVGTGSREADSPNVQFLARFLADGRLDPSFGENGVVIREAGGGITGMDILIEPDGRIVTTGAAKMTEASDIALARYLPDGRPDPSFGEAGFVWTQVAYHTDRPRQLLRQPDGKYIVAGGAHSGVDYDLVLARYLPSGELDATFAEDGILVEDLGDLDHIHGAVLQPDGKVLGVGRSGPDAIFVRWLPDGSRDSSFGDSGLARLQGIPGVQRSLQAVSLRKDGGAVAVGYRRQGGQAYETLVVTVTVGGELDPKFGDAGVQVVDVAPGAEEGFALSVDEPGGILVVGRGETARGDNDLLAFRLDVHGTVLPGTVRLIDLGQANEAAYDLRVSEGGVVVSGASRRVGGTEMLLVKLSVTPSP